MIALVWLSIAFAAVAPMVALSLPLPPVPAALPFPSSRDRAALVTLLIFPLLAAAATILSIYLYWLSLLSFALTVPILAAKVAGRRPVLYGCAANTAYCFWLAWGGSWAYHQEMSPAYFVMWIVLLLMACLPGLVLSRFWRSSALG